ncbi:MAG: SDR family oxidoreductase [Anaerolineae bacterium]|nr:SDR family oxidoreductase [Anaerolineae bacterium]
MSDRRKVIVTGASSGIGKATTRRFASEGWDVCLTARREKEMLAIRETLPKGDHLVRAGDYSQPETAESIRRAILEKWGRLDVLVNCAGMSLHADAIEASLAQWRVPFDVMFNGAVHMTRMAVPLMTEGGRVIHVTSIHGERGETGASSYGMAKAAINQYCRVLAIELAPRGILVNVIAPGFVDTPMSVKEDGTNELESEWFARNYVRGQHLPLKRAGRPEEIAGVAFFLAGPDATYITGQVITVDGGLTITF